jgi:hypothetical protein
MNPLNKLLCRLGIHRHQYQTRVSTSKKYFSENMYYYLRKCACSEWYINNKWGTKWSKLSSLVWAHDFEKEDFKNAKTLEGNK